MSEWRAHNRFVLRHRFALVLMAVLPAIALSACARSTSATTYMAYQLTCCAAADINSPWTPGSTFDLHLLPTGPQVITTVNPSHHVRISGLLSGPYADAATLKKGGSVAAVISGSSFEFDDRAKPSGDAVITFALPADLPAGLYNLVLTWDLGDGSSSSASSIVQVAQS